MYRKITPGGPLEIVVLRNIYKSFGETHAVENLSFSVPKGKIFGLLGPNGAGKTSTLRMIMQILLPDQGTIELFGKALDPSAVNRIGYMPEERGLYKKMKVVDCVAFFGELKGLSPSKALTKAKEWLERFDLLAWKEKKIEELSKGMQQKVQFIITVLHEPELLILDEPFSGFDPVNVDEMKNFLLEMKAKGTTIIFSSHQMEQVEKLCDSICLIHHGKNVLSGTLSEVKAKFGKNRIRIYYDGQAKFLKDRSLVAESNDFGKYVEIQPAQGVSPNAILERAIQEISIHRFEMTEPSLHDIFVQLVKNQGEQIE